MSLAEQEAAKKAAEELRELIVGVRTEVKANNGQVTDLVGKVALLETKMQGLTQAQDALNRAGFDRSHAGDGAHDLDEYTRGNREHDYQTNRAHYFMDPGKEARTGVRLTAHKSLMDPGDPASAEHLWGLFDDPQPKTDWHRELQQLVNSHSIVRAHLNQRIEPGVPARRAWISEGRVLRHLKRGPDEIRKIFSNVSGQGSDWMPSQPVPELERQIMFQPSRWQIFRQLQLTRSPIVRPRRSGFLRTYLGAVPASDDPAANPSLSTWTTASDTISVQELATGSQYHLFADEDSIIAFEPEIRMDLASAHVFAIENAITNGDTTASHMDAIASWDTRSRLGTSGIGLSNDQRRAWIGLRKFAKSLTSMTTDTSNAPLTTAMIQADLGTIHAESLLQSDGQIRVVYEISPETFFSTVVSLAEFDAFDNVGMLASVLTGQIGDLARTPGGLLPGQVGFIFGRFPILVNYTLTKDLNASGVFDNVTKTRTGSLCYDVSRFQVPMIRGMTIATQDDIRNNTRTLVSRQRINFISIDTAGSTVKTCQWRYNISA